MDFLKLTKDKLSIEEAMKNATAPNCGAVSFFVGTTRDTFEGKKVLSLEYEAYETMTYKEFKKICSNMREKWKAIENIVIYHRLGIVTIEEASVIIAISSPHRIEALEATQWCIDTLKKNVPIWKKEIYEKTEPEWKENYECDWSVKKEYIKNKEDFIESEIELDNVPSHLIQITCPEEELKRRIQAFMDRKRDQANIANIREFCSGVKPDSDSCARVDAIVLRQKNSKSHLKMARVYNTYGPLSNQNANQTMTQNIHISDAIEERIKHLENNLEIVKPVPKDVYQRLKEIEDRILYLETLSPEYANFWNKNSIFQTTDEPSNKRKYSVDEIDKMLWDLEEKSME